jgi:hypothetical protein
MSNENDAIYLYKCLRSFILIYFLYFLVDIQNIFLHFIMVFQHKFVDINSVESIIKTKIIQISILFINERVGLMVLYLMNSLSIMYF